MTAGTDHPPRDDASFLRRVAREPMVHFVLLAALVFLAYAAVSPPAPPALDRIVVTAQDGDRLRAQYRSTWNRDPSDAEFRRLVDNYVREEVFYREARSYGLDIDDQVVRVRMRQKMEFLLEDPAAVPGPAEADLVALFEATAQKYVTPASISFRQVFLGDPAAGGPEAALAALAGGADPATLGAPSLLPAEMAAARPAAVDGDFGEGFFARIADLPAGGWTGPVRSAFGQHLVLVSEVTTTEPPRLGDVRAAVEAEWRRIETRKVAEAAYATLKDRYRIDLSAVGLSE